MSWSGKERRGKENCKGASIIFNGFQNPNNVQIGVGGLILRPDGCSDFKIPWS